MLDSNIIPFQLPLPPVLPTIEGNVDYRELRDQRLRINELLLLSGLESHLLETDLHRWLARGKTISAKAQQNRQRHSQRALRCNIARILLKENFRRFAARLADSPLLQFFCALSEVDCVCVPSKSTLQRYDQWWTEAEVRQLIHQVLKLHHAKLHADWRTEQQPEFTLSYLPPYSPDLNPIERVWKLTRRLCLHNCYFPALDDVVQAVEEQFAAWVEPNETLRRLCTVA